MKIALERPDQPDVVALIDELDAYQRSLYPAESCYLLDLDALMQPEVLFAVARDDHGRAVGCAAVVLGELYGELKRMYVHPAARGQGVAQGLLACLEGHAMDAGCPRLMLETGPSQPEALRLYERAGFERRGPFGSYRDDPFSVFMHKPLSV